MSSTVTPTIETSTWSVDPSHSSVHFKVRHMMISNVRGEFGAIRGALTLNGADITLARLNIEIETASIQTRDQQRDAHLRSADFLDVEHFPAMSFQSTKITKLGADAMLIDGELTIRDVKRVVTLDVDSVSPVTKDPWGHFRLAAGASTVISRKDFGLTWNAALETGGVLVGDEVAIEIEIQFVKSQA